jgi:anti-sigma regulatory factor (Ser/Thr protein kinase)
VTTQVEIEIPPRSAYVSVVRLALASLARAAGLGEESVDDLKIAVGEACTNAVLVAERSPDTPVKVNWTQEDARVVIEVTGTGHPYDEATPEQGDDLASRMRMSRALLESLVDSCDITERAGGGVSARLVVNL